MHNATAHTSIQNELQAFVKQCKELTSNEVYELFENGISQDLRDNIYLFAEDNGLSKEEPVRAALNMLGATFNVQSLIDY